MCPIECLPNRLEHVLHTQYTETCTSGGSCSRSFHAQPCISLFICPPCYHMPVGVGCLRGGCISGMRQRARQPCQVERMTVNGLTENQVCDACAGPSAALPQAAALQRAKRDDAAKGEWSALMGVIMRRCFLSGRYKEGQGRRAMAAGPRRQGHGGRATAAGPRRQGHGGSCGSANC